jgi:hypothetical protein
VNMTRKANPFTLRCNPLRVTTTMTFRVRGSFHLFNIFQERSRLFSFNLGRWGAGFFSGSSTPWGAGRTCLSLALFEANSSPVLNLSRWAPRIFFWLGAASWLCGDRSLALLYGLTNSHIVSSLTTRTGAIWEGDGECLLYGYWRNTNE